MDTPLSDVVVLDLTRAVAGPIIGRLLSDLGARVVKIEPPDADLTRFVVPDVNGMSAYFTHFNAGKECVSIDLTNPDGKDLFLSMVPHADIVLENYRPGVIDRLGIGYEVLSQIKPDIILGSVSGWGPGNERSDRGAFASAIHAETGVTEMVARRRGTPQGSAPLRNDPMATADTATGLHALAAVLAALHMRDRTGKGQTVEVSMAESMLMSNDQVATELTGEDPPGGFKSGQNWSGIYRLKDGRHVNITIDVTANFGFKAMMSAIDRPDLADDPRYTDMHKRAPLRDELEALFAEWIAQFDDPRALETAIGVKAVFVAEVQTVAELAKTDWANTRGAFVDIDAGERGSLTVPQAPWRFGDSASGAKPIVGDRGQHNRQVLEDLAGLDDAQLDDLEARGVISHGEPVFHPSRLARGSQ